MVLVEEKPAGRVSEEVFTFIPICDWLVIYGSDFAQFLPLPEELILLEKQRLLLKRQG